MIPHSKWTPSISVVYTAPVLVDEIISDEGYLGMYCYVKEHLSISSILVTLCTLCSGILVPKHHLSRPYTKQYCCRQLLRATTAIRSVYSQATVASNTQLRNDLSYMREFCCQQQLSATLRMSHFSHEATSVNSLYMHNTVTECSPIITIHNLS